MAKTIGRYEIREELVRGGMASVYLAYDSRLDRQAALTLIDQNRRFLTLIFTFGK
jgi:hypothetical protein